MAKKNEEGLRYFDIEETIDKYPDADYYIIYGERSNGKTTSVEGHCLKEYIESSYTRQFAIVRRWEEDFKGVRGSSMFNAIVNLGWIDKWSKGLFNTVYYYAQKWYLAKADSEGKIVNKQEQPFCYAFAISSEEHYKSTSYPDIYNILFDEFITRKMYLPDEFIKFQNLMSTIIRLKDDVKIFMCGNTINKYNPYFIEMGLKNAYKQEPDSIDIYRYGESDLTVACQFTGGGKLKKASNKYFAFDNPKLDMITKGSWEVDIYPHLPFKYTRSDIVYIYYIMFQEQILQCEIIKPKNENYLITYIHKKTTPIPEDNKKSIVFQQDYSPNPIVRRKINVCYDIIGKKIWSMFVAEKVFYQDNEIGELVRNYLMWCKKEA